MSKEEGAIYDEETEQAVLGAMLDDDKAIPSVLTILGTAPDVFYSKIHQIVYECIQTVYDENQTGDTMLVAKEVKKRNQVNRIGGLPYLYDLLNRAVDTTNIEYYAEIVKENFTRRKLQSASARFKNLAQDATKDIVEVIDEAEQLITDLNPTNTQKLDSLPRIMEQRYVDLMERKEQKEAGTLTDMRTGFYDLDEHQTASDPQTTFVIGGAPGAGKSSLMRNIAYQRFLDGYKGLLFTTEMSRDSVADCFYASIAGVSISGVKKLSLSEDQWKEVGKVKDDVSELAGWIDDSGRPPLSYIKSQARDKKNKEGLDFIAVDYLQHCGTTGYSTKADELESFAYALDGLAHELDIHVILVSQLSRSARRQPDAVSWGYKSSGGIEEACTCAVQLKRTLIHPQEGKGLDVSDKEIIDCTITKDKFEATDIFPLVFEKPTLTFRDLEPDELELYRSINFD